MKKNTRTPSRDRPKAPPSSGSDIHEPDRFMEFIAALEICRGLVCSGSPVPIRLALIILDNVAEVLMLHKCSAILERDRFMSRVISPEYSGNDRARVETDFRGKVWFLSTKVNRSTRKTRRSSALGTHIGTPGSTETSTTMTPTR